MEYINSRKRLIVDRGMFGNHWCLQYRVKAWWGYTWVTVARSIVGYQETVNRVIEHLEDIRVYNKFYSY